MLFKVVEIWKALRMKTSEENPLDFLEEYQEIYFYSRLWLDMQKVKPEAIY